jgi:hypothetical protein
MCKAGVQKFSKNWVPTLEVQILDKRREASSIQKIHKY